MTIYNQKSPDFRNAESLADALLLSLDENVSFPLKITKIIEDISDLRLCTFKRARDYGVNISAFGSEDAILIEQNGKKILFYNDEISSCGRKRFSLVHELAHYHLQHDLDDKENYSKYEAEANCFTAEFLMPLCIPEELVRRGVNLSADKMMKWFNVSREMANNRLETLAKRTECQRRSFDDSGTSNILIKRFGSFIDGIAPDCRSLQWFEDEYAQQQERDSWY